MVLAMTNNLEANTKDISLADTHSVLENSSLFEGRDSILSA